MPSRAEMTYNQCHYFISFSFPSRFAFLKGLGIPKERYAHIQHDTVSLLLHKSRKYTYEPDRLSIISCFAIVVAGGSDLPSLNPPTPSIGESVTVILPKRPGGSQESFKFKILHGSSIISTVDITPTSNDEGKEQFTFAAPTFPG